MYSVAICSHLHMLLSYLAGQANWFLGDNKLSRGAKSLNFIEKLFYKPEMKWDSSQFQISSCEDLAMREGKGTQW